MIASGWANLMLQVYNRLLERLTDFNLNKT